MGLLWWAEILGPLHPHNLLRLPLKHICLLFPTSSGISFSAVTLTFSEAEVLIPTPVPNLLLGLKIFPYCFCLETVASWALTELPFVLSH